MYPTDVYKMHTKCIYTIFRQAFVYNLWTKSKELCQLNFVYKMYTKVCQNVVYILYTKIFYTTFYIHFAYKMYSLLKCEIHFVYINSNLLKAYIINFMYIYNLYTKFIQNVYK